MDWRQTIRQSLVDIDGARDEDGFLIDTTPILINRSWANRTNYHLSYMAQLLYPENPTTALEAFKRIISDYTLSAGDYNSMLRWSKDSDFHGLTYVASELLNLLVSTSYAPQNAVVYRFARSIPSTMPNQDLPDIDPQLQVGQAITFPGLVSTAMTTPANFYNMLEAYGQQHHDSSGALCCYMTIHISEGHPALYIAHLAIEENQHQMELLLPSGSKFTVSRRQGIDSKLRFISSPEPININLARDHLLSYINYTATTAEDNGAREAYDRRSHIIRSTYNRRNRDFASYNV